MGVSPQTVAPYLSRINPSPGDAGDDLVEKHPWDAQVRMEGVGQLLTCAGQDR